MATSHLYAGLIARLSLAAPEWEALLATLRGMSGSDALNHSGDITVQNIHLEDQLSTNPSTADAALFEAFARDLLTALATSCSDNDIGDKYENACKPHVLKGRCIPTTPKRVFRYVNGSGILRKINSHLQTSHPSIADELSRLIDEAESGTPGATWTAALEFAMHTDVLRKITPPIKLAPREHVFVTFDTTSSHARRTATSVHNALALWLPLRPCFIEFSYIPEPSSLRYPTVADAGWFKFYRSTPHTEDHGWTNPHATDPPEERQPEAVQQSPLLDASITARIVPL